MLVLKNSDYLLPETRKLLTELVATATFLTPGKIKRFNLSSLEAIAGMKVNTMFLRAKFRDYYDLYFLVREGMTLQEIFHYSKDMIAGVTFKMLAIALVYTDDVEDENIAHLQPESKINIKEIRSFFEEKLKLFC